MQSDREEDGSVSTEINIFQPGILLHNRERQEHIISLETHVEQAFEAIRTGNTELLSVLLHDGLDYERSLIRSIDNQLFQESMARAILAYKIEVYQVQKQYLYNLIWDFQRHSSTENKQETDKIAYELALKHVMNKHQLNWAGNIEQTRSNHFSFKQIIVPLISDAEKRVCREEFELKLQKTENTLKLPNQLDERTCRELQDKISEKKMTCETELATFTSKISEIERLRHAARKRMIQTAIVQKKHEHRDIITDREKSSRLCIEYRSHSEEMLSADVSPNAKRENGQTLLHAAIVARNAGMVDLLMQRGGIPFEKGPVQTKDGIIQETAFSQASRLAQESPDKTIIRNMISKLQSMEQKKLMAYELLAAQNAVALQVKEMFATVKTNLDKYANKVKKRLGDDFIDTIIYSLHLDDRIHDLEKYYQSWFASVDTGDLNAFGNQATWLNKNAQRGILGRSELHSSVSAVLEKEVDWHEIQLVTKECIQKMNERIQAVSSATQEFQDKISGKEGELRTELYQLQRKYDREHASNSRKIEQLERDKKEQLAINKRQADDIAELKTVVEDKTRDIAEHKMKIESLTNDSSEKDKKIIELTEDRDKQKEINTDTNQRLESQESATEEQRKINQMLMERLAALEKEKKEKKEKKERKGPGFY